MSEYHIDTIIPCGKSDGRPVQIRPVIPVDGLRNLVVKVTNNLGDTSPLWVNTQNGKAVNTPNFVKETDKWEIGLHITADADSTDAYVGEPCCYIEAAKPDGRLSIEPWATATGDEIAAMIRAAHAGIIDLYSDAGWRVGNIRTIPVGTESIDIAIASFADYENCGCVMQFDFKDALATAYRMNSSNTNVGGYAATEMYKTTLPAVVNRLPDYLKNMLIPFNVKTSAGNQSSEIVTVENNLLALRSEIEIFGSTSYSKAGEGVQVDYYKTSSNRIKKRGHSGSATSWWERSPNGSGAANFCYVSNGGSAGSNGASNTYGCAPFGCI